MKHLITQMILENIYESESRILGVGSTMCMSFWLMFVSGLIACATLSQSREKAGGKRLGEGSVYSVIEISFHGPRQSPTDAPARDIDFWVQFRHESGSPEYKIHGFWDGNGKGGNTGDVFKVRFCPTKGGRWNLVEVYSNIAELSEQRQGDYVIAKPSNHHGFWIVDPNSAGQRWYMRSDGTHQYIFGNTHYSFLSGYQRGNKPTDNDIVDDVIGNANYFKKLRFSLYGDHYPHPTEKPFLNDNGQPTDWGDYSHRPNPKWFHQRADLAVQTAYDNDLVADLILAGPDREESRSTLRARHNKGDPTPFLKYIAARYGSYPNVWLCLCNEFDIRDPNYSEEEIAQFGQIIREFLPYPTPLSVHATPRKSWSQEFDNLSSWNDHQILQNKIRHLAPSADVIQAAWENSEGNQPRYKPTINDELSYQGEGDKHTEGDTIESHLGAFLGGGYATTGEKPGNKTGQYFKGKFDLSEHTAAVKLKWLREIIDDQASCFNSKLEQSVITFWKMSPDLSIFSNIDSGFRGMAWPGYEYVFGTNKSHKGIVAQLPSGTWMVKQYDVIAQKTTTLSTQAKGQFEFDAPDSRAVLFHFKKKAVVQGH